MTSVFVYEYLTGGGLLADAQAAAPPSLLAEGEAMVAALAADFVAAGVRVTCLRDRRLASWSPGGCRAADVFTPAQHAKAFDRFASEADWTVVIAPEMGGALSERCRRVADVGGRLLGPSAAVVDLASDKQATAEFLTAADIPMPAGTLLPRGMPWPRDFSYPAVWKPLDGAGSQDVAYISNPDQPQFAPDRRPGRLERFCPGDPASAALLCGPGGLVCVLPACRQCLSDDGRFGYLGGSLPLPPELERRAQALAKRITAALPGAFGYVGVDLVLGARADGGDDVAIEINPRLTTSYIGLRAACERNLAEAMLEVAQGRDIPSPQASRATAFKASGEISAETSFVSRAYSGCQQG